MKPRYSNHYYNKSLRPFANKLRKQMTQAEVCLWKHVLRARQLKGYQFRRQRPVLQYIADFMCKELMLIIEVDGLSHQFMEVIQNDDIRQKNLEAVGFTVLRFTDDQILNSIGQVYEYLAEWIDKNSSIPPALRNG